MKPDSVYIIGEAGVNHNGQRDLAFALIDVAADAGVDAVKFQTFTAEKLASKSAPKADYQKESTDALESQLAMLKRLELPREWHAELQTYARNKGIEFLSTAFDSESLEFLRRLDMPLFKVPSGELTNLPLLWQFARSGKPLILSTGMATLGEVEEALAVIAHAWHATEEPSSVDEVRVAWSIPEKRHSLRGRVSLLHCTSQYPTPLEQVNLNAMKTLAEAFDLTVGYSDHTQGTLIPIAAVACGAKIIEKHFTLSHDLPGPDHKASLEPDALKRMVDDIRMLEQAFGDGVKAPQACEWGTRSAARQQVVAARQIPAGKSIVREDLTTARCGGGLPAAALWEIVGQHAARAYEAGELIIL